MSSHTLPEVMRIDPPPAPAALPLVGAPAVRGMLLA